MSETSDIIQSLDQHLSALTDTSTQDRPVKKRAIEAVKKETQQITKRKDASAASTQLLDHLLDSLLVSTESAIENVREQTVGVLVSLIQNCDQGSIKQDVTNKLLLSAKTRLRQEETEEIRVIWIELCTTMMVKVETSHGELWMDIMQVAGQDRFADVQKQTAKLIVLYAKHNPKSIDYACERMVRLVIPLLLHKHTAVRVAGIKAMKAVLMASPKGLHLLFEYDQVLDRQPIVPGLIYDTSALVRDHLFIVLGKLLCEWNPRDRYQYGELVLPIILSGTLDDLPSVQITCKSSMSKVGLSCTQDLVGAGILDTFPADEKEAEIIGIKHLVHMCYDKSVSQLMHSSTNFVKVRQETGLDSLKLFLEYASVDDLVRSIKRLTQCLFQVYATTEQASIKTRVYDILSLLLAHLPSPEICIEVLTLKLDRKRLAAETEGFPGNLVVTVTMAFLEHTLSSSTMSESSKQRVISIMSKPYLTEYLDLEATQHYQQVVQAFQKI